MKFGDFCKKFSKQDALIDFTQPARVLFNRFRAYHPWPGFYCFCNGERVVIECVKMGTEKKSTLSVGEFEMDHQDLRVQCGEGHLLVSTLKPAGSKSMSAQAYFTRIKAKGWNTRFSNDEKL